MARLSVLEGAGDRGRKGRGRDRSGAEQLDLFAGLGSSMRLSDPPLREPEHVRMVLPPEPSGIGRRVPDPPDVASDVRGIFSGADAEETGAREGGLFPDEPWNDGGRAGAASGGGAVPEPVVLGRAGAPTEGKPLPPTGVFRRPQPPVEEPPEEEPEDAGDDAPAEGAAAVLPWGMRLRAWLAGLEWNGRMAAGVGVAMVAAMALGIASARGCGGGAETTETAETTGTAEISESSGKSESFEVADAGGEAAGGVLEELPPVQTAEPVASEPPATVPELPAALKGWAFSGAKVAEDASGVTVTFEVPLFESAAYISKAGMPVLKALGAKLKGLEGGTVMVTGYTDNVPLSRPTAEFQSNADVAAARADVAADHLKAFAKNSRLSFRVAAGAESEAPWPNDTPEHRRLNRTAVVRVTPAQP